MQDSKVLPDLRMFPVKLLVPHEDVDPRRTEKLSKRLLEEGMLKNPPMVATIPGSDRYIVLDGANRVMAFVLLKIPHIVAQLVNYSNQDVILDTWYHVVAGISEADFERGLTEMVGLELVDCSLDEARRAMAAGEALAYIVCEDGVRKALLSLFIGERRIFFALRTISGKSRNLIIPQLLPWLFSLVYSPKIFFMLPRIIIKCQAVLPGM
jgi:hypothetical protein